jgi:tetraacyldisaccharide 4'-kinase
MPISFLYGIGVSIKNILYSSGFLRSLEFSVPVIGVGNLSIGGAGKTPHIEYLIEMLQPYVYVATLSRGYKRRTSGFRFIKATDNVYDAGDEPLQFARKFPNIQVFVAENRALGIPEVVKNYPQVQTILLDDAFQHRAVKPGVNILLTQYESPFYEDYLLPAGRLREWRAAYQRADIIVVTKCLENLSEEEAAFVREKIEILQHQKLFFSYYRYYPPYSFYFTDKRIQLSKDMNVILLSAIANTSYLKKHIEQAVSRVINLEYTDHHYFNEADTDYIIDQYNNLQSDKKIILTTEKDAMRLDVYKMKFYQQEIPIFVLPVKVEFLFDQGEEFNAQIKEYLMDFKV